MKTLQFYKDELAAKVVAMRAESAAITCTMKESFEARTKLGEIIGAICAGEMPNTTWLEMDEGLFAKAKKWDLLCDAKDYEASLDSNLTQLTETYLITDGNIVSPAGFAPSSFVTIIDGNVWIQCNKLPRHLSDNLKAYDLRKLRAELMKNEVPKNAASAAGGAA